MQHRQQLLSRWEKQVPALQKSEKWWLEGDSRVLLVIDDLAELLEAVEANYGSSSRQVVYKARHDEHGDLWADMKYAYVVADYVQDASAGWHEGADCEMTEEAPGGRFYSYEEIGSTDLVRRLNRDGVIRVRLEWKRCRVLMAGRPCSMKSSSARIQDHMPGSELLLCGRG